MLLSCSVLISQPVHAALNIEIFGGGATQIPIAIVPFAAEEKLKQSITPVVAADLQRSGLFRLVDPGGLRPHEPVEVVYPDWMNRGASALVIGSTTTVARRPGVIACQAAGRGKTSAVGGLYRNRSCGAVARRRPSHSRYDL